MLRALWLYAIVREGDMWGSLDGLNWSPKAWIFYVNLALFHFFILTVEDWFQQNTDVTVCLLASLYHIFAKWKIPNLPVRLDLKTTYKLFDSYKTTPKKNVFTPEASEQRGKVRRCEVGGSKYSSFLLTKIKKLILVFREAW